MSYQINEGVLPVNPAQDRSINIVTLQNDGDGAPLQVIITRDAGEAGETLADSMARQVRTLSRQVKEFKQIAREEVQVGTELWPALLQEHRFRQAGQAAHQIQIMARPPQGDLMIFTLSCAAPISEAHRAAWVDAVRNFQPTPA